MESLTGYLLGKVQLDGAIRSEVLANLVSTLLLRYQVPEPGKKQLKFHDGIKYSVECSERGLKLTAPGFRSRDEGFESDSESLRSIKIHETAEIDLIHVMDTLTLVSCDEKESDRHPLSSLSSSGASTDNTSISSSSNIHASDDSNSSSGNGSDSDEFSSTPNSSGERSPPGWEQLPNLSSFQSYPIEDVVFCHADTFHPSTLVWVVRHLTKMTALITSFRSRSEAEQLFQKYRDVRLKVKPVKHKMNGGKLVIPPIPNSPAPPPPPPRTCSVLSTNLGSEDHRPFTSLRMIQPTEILLETQTKSKLFSSPESKPVVVPVGETGSSLLAFKFNKFPTNPDSPPSSSGTIPRTFNNNSMSLRRLYGNPPTPTEQQPMGDEEEENEELESESEDNSDDDDDESQVTRIRAPLRPQRKVHVGFGKSKSGKPLLLVPLKNEGGSTPRSSYPKESYLYHVMGRTSSTFAPYQRSLNFVPSSHSPGSGTEYLSWASTNGHQLLVPFSSWTEISEVRKHNQTAQRRAIPLTPKSLRRGISKTSTLSHLNGKGTAKILLRDSAGHHSGVWANLSQRVKHNFRENLMPKLNGMWTQPGEEGNSSSSNVKKKPNKKVRFNAWATVQMV